MIKFCVRMSLSQICITKKSTPKTSGVLFPLLDFAHSYRFADESETIKKQAVSRVDAPKEIRVSKLAH